jgi:signal transduction histidine kinase
MALPSASRSPTEATHREPEPPRLARILVVEDEAIIALDLCMRLRCLGYDVVGHACCADQAFSLASRRRPDLVLMDIMIAGECDGIETAQLLQERFDVGVVYLTAYGDEATVARAGRAKPYGFLLKPVRDDDLRCTVEMALHQRTLGRGLCEELARSKTAETGVGAENVALDQRVAERTQELARVNEQLVEMSERLQQAIRAKDAFMAGMSHELRTPLASIVGFTDTLLMGLHGELNKTQARHMVTIQRNSEHLLSLINDLLDLAKISAGPPQLCPEGVGCHGLVEEVVASAAPLAAVKRLTLRASVSDPQLTVFADRRAVRQILLNLVSNAIKFTARGGVEVHCRKGTNVDSMRVLLEVRDSGPGLCTEDLERLFQPFSQLASIEGSARGTGLGLHLSLKLAQQMYGAIRVDSELDIGSVFTLVLPLHATSRA